MILHLEVKTAHRGFKREMYSCPFFQLFQQANDRKLGLRMFFPKAFCNTKIYIISGTALNFVNSW